jgi:hypothetical protein
MGAGSGDSGGAPAEDGTDLDGFIIPDSDVEMETEGASR